MGYIAPSLSCRPECAASAAHLQAALNGVASGVLTFDAALAIRFANDRMAVMLDAPMPLPGTALPDWLAQGAVLGQEAADAVGRACRAAVDGLTRTPDVSAKDGGRHFTARVSAADEGHWLLALEDVTARREAEARAIEVAMRDPLTGLANRDLFLRRLARALCTADGSYAVLMVDLDRFKAVNDTLGHPVGDGLLRLVGRRLRSVLREEDAIARLGGDEFALLLSPAPDRAQLGRLAARIIDVLGRPYIIDGHQVNIGASAGIATAPGDGRTPDAVLRSADLALYAAKQSGRGTYSLFDRAMDERALARRSLEIDLRKSIALRQFELHYQPQINVENRAVVGFEALLRWRHPERGLVPPGEFIPLAEEIGLIVTLGECVVREACRRAAQWPGAVSVAVNVSPHQFEDPARLVQVVSQALAESGLPGERLEVEITESVLLRNESAVTAALHRLRALGVRVAMDDFGTGYSSLSQLHAFPFDKIKIDRSFVTDRDDVAGQNAIIRAITALGVSLGMSTIAEGVETPDQLARIRAEGCGTVQGYLFSRPVPPEQVDGLIAQFTPRDAPVGAADCPRDAPGVAADCPRDAPGVAADCPRDAPGVAADCPRDAPGVAAD